MLYLLTGGVLGPLGVLMAALAAGIWECGRCRESLEGACHRGTCKPVCPISRYRPKRRQSRHIYEIYRGAKERVLAAIEADLESRQAEIDNLRNSMRRREIDNEQERARLLAQDAALLTTVHDIELAEDRWLKAL